MATTEAKQEEEDEEEYSNNDVSDQSATIADTEKLPLDHTSNNDLMSRLSSFLPQIRAANIDLVNTVQTNDKHQSTIQIDGNLLLDNDDDGEDNDDDDSDTDEEDIGTVDDEKDDIIHFVPNKRRKKESTPVVCIDLHMNKDMDNPLFQALLNDASSDHDDGDNNNNNRNSTGGTKESNDVEETDPEKATISHLVLPINKKAAINGKSPLIQEVLDD